MAGTPVEIPLTPAQNQRFSIQLGTETYTLTLIYNDQLDGGWYMDIGDDQNNPLALALPLVTGADLLAQLQYLGIPGQLIVQTDHNIDAVPTFDNLGINSHLYFIPNE